MSDQNRQDPTPASIDEIEIDPLSDEALEEVAGGSGGCSCVSCSNTTPDIRPDDPAM